MRRILYVVGFARSPQNQIALIRKNRPDYMTDKLNGVGGKIEAFETSYQAMCREFFEEAGLTIIDWKYRGTLDGDAWNIDVYTANLSQEMFDTIHTVTDEPIEIHALDSITSRTDIMPNLRWIIPMVFDSSMKTFQVSV